MSHGTILSDYTDKRSIDIFSLESVYGFDWLGHCSYQSQGNAQYYFSGSLPYPGTESLYGNQPQLEPEPEPGTASPIHREAQAGQRNVRVFFSVLI